MKFFASRLKSLVFVSCLSVFCLIVSCKCKKTTQEDWQGVRVHLAKEPASLDWHKATDVPSRTVTLALTSTLTDYEFDGVRPVLVPSLAESWQSNQDATRWKFQLRRDVKWSDGEPFVSAHVVESLRRFLTPETAAFNSYYFYSIVGAEEFNQGKTTDFQQVGIVAKDDFTVEFQLKRPVVYFPQLLALFNTAPWREDFMTEEGQLVVNEKLPSLGPFKIAEVKPGEWIRLIRNKSFFREKVKAEKLEFKIIAEPTTALNLFRSGRLDIVTELPEAEKQSLKAAPTYREVKELSIEYLGFNMEIPPFNNIVHRRLLKRFTQTQAIVELLDAGETANPGFIPEGVAPALPSGPSPAADKDESIPALQFTLSFPSEPKQQRIAQLLQAQWQTNSAWRVELQPQDWKVFLSRVNSEPPMLYRLGWMAIFPDPMLFLSLWTSTSHYNTSGWTSQTYDKLVQEIEGETDAEAREKLVLRALKILDENVVVIPLYRGSRQELVQENIRGYAPNSLNRPNWANIFREAL